MQRSRVVALTVLMLLPRILPAQESRFSIEPFVSHVSRHQLYDKSIAFPPVGAGGSSSVSTEQLSLAPALAVGLRATMQLDSRWVIGSEASLQSMTYTYTSEWRSQQLLGSERWYGGASATSLVVSLGRSILSSAHGVSLDALVEGGTHRLRVGDEVSSCPIAPPSAGSRPPCAITPKWQSSYTVRSLGGGLVLSKSITPRVGLRSRVVYSVGRANTAPFWTDFRSEFDQYEADRSHDYSTVQLSLGLAIGL